jgi:GT2 family glycosyltransferase
MTRNRRETLLRTLRRHQAPVIVVDNGSTDGTADAVADARLPDVTVIRLDRNAGACARNVGVAAAATSYVAFADDDSWWEPGALDQAAALLDRHPRIGLLAARILLGESTDEDPICRVMARSPLTEQPGLPGPSVLGFVACASVVRKEAFFDAGGFDDLIFFAGEEALLSIDLASHGWAQCYAAAVVARHQPSPVRTSAGHRRRLLSRNAVLTAVLRRSWRAVFRVVWHHGRSGCWSAAGVAAVLPRLPSALRRRRPVDPDLERRLQLISTI